MDSTRQRRIGKDILLVTAMFIGSCSAVRAERSYMDTIKMGHDLGKQAYAADQAIEGGFDFVMDCVMRSETEGLIDPNSIDMIKDNVNAFKHISKRAYCVTTSPYSTCH